MTWSSALPFAVSISADHWTAQPNEGAMERMILTRIFPRPETAYYFTQSQFRRFPGLCMCQILNQRFSGQPNSRQCSRGQNRPTYIFWLYKFNRLATGLCHKVGIPGKLPGASCKGTYLFSICQNQFCIYHNKIKVDICSIGYPAIYIDSLHCCAPGSFPGAHPVSFTQAQIFSLENT